MSAVPDIQSEMKPVTETLQKHFGGVDDMHWAARKVYTLNCNWKLINDNYLDGEYHIPFVHKGLNNNLDMSTYKTELYNSCSIQTAKTAQSNSTARDVKVGEDFKERVGDTVFYAFIYPNVCINRYGNMMDTNYVLPLAHNKSAIIYDYFFSKQELAKKPEYIEKCLAASDTVQTEDTLVCERMQLGLQSISYDKGRYAPTKETATYHFHRKLASDLVSQ